MENWGVEFLDPVVIFDMRFIPSLNRRFLAHPCHRLRRYPLFFFRLTELLMVIW